MKYTCVVFLGCSLSLSAQSLDYKPAPSSPLRVPGGGHSFVAGDVDKDGHVDLVIVENNRLSVMLGDGKGDFNPVPIQQSGFLSRKDAKALALIHVGKEETPVILGTNNNDSMFAYEFVHNTQRKITLTQHDRYAEIYYKDGKKERQEVNIGSGYLSQGSLMISFLPELVDKIIVTDDKNQQRTVFESNALASK